MSTPKYNPRPVNPRSEFMAMPAIEGELAKYLETLTPQPVFVKTEVNVLGAFGNDHIVPFTGAHGDATGQGHPKTIFVGEWYRHPDVGLYVRFGGGNDIALVQEGSSDFSKSNNTFREWYFEWRKDLNDGFLDLTKRLRHEELQRAASLTIEFVSTIRTYERLS